MSRRVIQKKEFQRVGDDRTITVDARIIAKQRTET